MLWAALALVAHVVAVGVLRRSSMPHAATWKSMSSAAAMLAALWRLVGAYRSRERQFAEARATPLDALLTRAQVAAPDGSLLLLHYRPGQELPHLVEGPSCSPDTARLRHPNQIHPNSGSESFVSFP